MGSYAKNDAKARKPAHEPYLRTRVNVISVIVGWLIILLGLFGIASPHSLIDAVLGWPTATRFYFRSSRASCWAFSSFLLHLDAGCRD